MLETVKEILFKGTETDLEEAKKLVKSMEELNDVKKLDM